MVKSKDADFEESKHKRDEGGKFSQQAAHHEVHFEHHEKKAAGFREKGQHGTAQHHQAAAEHHQAAAESFRNAHRTIPQGGGIGQGSQAHAKQGERHAARASIVETGRRLEMPKKAEAKTEAKAEGGGEADPKAKKAATTAVNNTLGSMRGHAGYLRELEHGQAFTHRPNAETGKFDRLNSHEAAERTLKNARELHGFVHTNSSDPKHHEAATKTLKNLEKLAEKVKAREPYSK